ncbi:MAG: hypothetical protein ACI93T_001568 [Porticoccaceae bacterium]
MWFLIVVVISPSGSDDRDQEFLVANC